MQRLPSWRVTKADVETLTTPGERRVVGGRKVEPHQPEQRRKKAFGLAERKVEDQAQRQGGFNGDVRVLPLPTASASSFRLPRGDGVRGQPDGDIAALDERLLVGSPVPHVVLRFVLRMDPRLHLPIVCRRPHAGRVDNGPIRGRAEQLCTNAPSLPCSWAR